MAGRASCRPDVRWAAPRTRPGGLPQRGPGRHLRSRTLNEVSEDRRNAAERLIAESLEDPRRAGRPISERARRMQRSLENYLKPAPPALDGSPDRDRDGTRRERRRLTEAYEALQVECGRDRARFAAAARAVAEAWSFEDLNELIRTHNEWYRSSATCRWTSTRATTC